MGELHMKLKITPSTLGYLGLIVWILFCLAGVILDYISPPYTPTIVKLVNSYPCKESDSRWVANDTFKADQSIYICARIESNVSDLHKQVQIYVFENELQTEINAIFYDNVWVSNGEVHILLKTNFNPGTYVISVVSGRKSLSLIQFDVSENNK